MVLHENMLWLLPVILLSLHTSGDPIVSTPLGKIRGYPKTSFSGRPFTAFEGIPYAQPPIGNHRFEKAEPVQKWEGIWNANTLHQCPQIFKTQLVGDEDCLYINVYVPDGNTSQNMDVIVHIHGGGFMVGNGHLYAFPGYLMDHDVVFVTFNYRLGIFGFLSTEDDVIPGNYGLKDQVLALEWIRDNIASFGGNPKSVTLNGASAGGASVHLHYFSPLSRGLFARGYSQSGCALNPWVLQGEPANKARILASKVGCPESPNQRLLECLKQRHYKQLLAQSSSFYGYRIFPVAPLGPVVENGSGAFLEQEPYGLLVSKQVQNLPWIVSFLEHEAYSMFSDFRNKSSELDAIWDQFAPLILHYNFTTPPQNWSIVRDEIRDFYFGKNVKVSSSYDTFVRVVTERLAVEGTSRSVSLQAQATNASVYFYKLSYTGDSKKYIGHGDDNQYFYWNGEKPSSNDLKMKDVLIEMLVKYAKTSKPSLNGVEWQPGPNLMTISGFTPSDATQENVTNLGNQEFWDSIGLGFTQNE